jgi:hypothetical protein
MLILYVIIVLLIIIILLLSIGLFFYLKKNIYLSEKEKEFIVFVIDIYEQYSDDLGIQSKEQHKKLVNELNKIKKKILK